MIKMRDLNRLCKAVRIQAAASLLSGNNVFALSAGFDQGLLGNLSGDEDDEE